MTYLDRNALRSYIVLPPPRTTRRHKPDPTFTTDNRADFERRLFLHRYCRRNVSSNMIEPTNNAKFLP